MKNLALHWKIIIGMVLGVVYGLLASHFGLIEFTNDWIKPWGKIFISLLKLIAVPLVLASLIKGISSLSDVSKLSRIGTKTICIYLISTVIAVSFGLILVNVVKPGSTFSPEKRLELKEQYASDANAKILSANKVEKSGPLQFVVDMVPENIISATSRIKICFRLYSLLYFLVFRW